MLYPTSLTGSFREIRNYLQNGKLLARVADQLIDDGFDWSLIAPQVQDLSWWQQQSPRLATSPQLDWKIQVQGASILLSAGEMLIGVDPGNNAPIPGREPDLVIVTHAHFDHTAQIDRFAHDYPSARIVMPALTVELLELRAVHDYALKAVLERTVRLNFNSPRVINEVCVNFLPAGHLLGAAMVDIKYGPDRILITGDFALREVGGLPGAKIPAESYNITLMGVHESRQGATPYADPQTNRLPFLKTVADRLALGQRPLWIPVQAFGQAQEAYAALAMAQQSGDFSDIEVYLKDMAASVSALYARELGQAPGPWRVPFNKVRNEIPANSVVILPEQNGFDPGENLIRKPAIYTHAGWAEQMAFAVGIACDQMYLYHTFNNSLDIALRNLGRKVCMT